MLTIPTESDWRSEPWCLDTEYAYKHLAGKSHDETVQLFHDNSLVYQEDVMFMPFACFPFYANAYIEYLRSDLANGDSDGANCFFGLVEVRMHEITNADSPIVERIVETLRHLGNNQDWFGADESIYGSFAKRAEQLLQNFNQ